MTTFNYHQMLKERAQMHREIEKRAKDNAKRYQEERKYSYCLHTPKETWIRLRKKAEEQSLK